jgi:ATP-dependent DNA helicase DinG
MDSREQQLFPHDSFRENQYETLKACLKALDDGYKNIVLDAPVGSGKSGICTALLRYADNGFYTSPQKSLREQVQSDEALQPHVEDLKARRDYHCRVSNSNCEDCGVYQSSERSCAEQSAPPCNYWRRKQTVMNSDISVITFAMLVIDSMIPTEVNGMKVSFDDRDMVVVDEAHGLVEQVREMHAGFDVTPYGLPDGIIGNATDSISWDANRYKDVQSELTVILQRCLDYVRDVPEMEMSDAEKRCHRLSEKIKQANKDVENGNPWVVDVEGKNYGNQYVKTLELRPIYVGNFLKNFVWNRGNKRIISTATLRHRNNPDIWLNQVGLDPENTKVISVGMTFPPKNRPVIKDYMVASMSDGGCEDNWGDVMKTLNEIAQKHINRKGICHTASYKRAKRVEETATEEEHPYLYKNIYVHSREEDADVAIEKWQNSDLDLFLSPSVMEGVDLDGDMGRYNVLMKVPYPPKNSWTNYILNELEWGWHSYFDRAAIRVAQAYGRTNRSKDDYSNFYVLDEDYEQLKQKATLPQWLTEAEDYPEVAVRSLFDY